MMVAPYLREHTQALHRQTEALAHGAIIMEARLSPKQYQVLIRKNEFLHRQLEPLFSERLTQYGLTEFQDLLHPRLRELEADLDLLSIAPLSFELSPPALKNGPQTLGGLYVLLGSYLGGRVIHKALKKNKQLDDIPEFHYFSAGRLFPSREWPHFCRMLDAHISDENDLKEALTGAEAVFRFFQAVYQTSSS